MLAAPEPDARRRAEVARTLIDAADRPCTERGPKSPFPLLFADSRRWPFPIAAAADLVAPRLVRLKANGEGDLLVDLMEHNAYQLDDWRCFGETLASVAQALIAIRAWQVERGALPPTLDALVPGYLSRVPADGYDGAPPSEERPVRDEPTWPIDV